MNVLFVHNNFPAQFQQLARFLAQQPGVRVAAIGARTSRSIKDVRLLKYALTDVDVSSSHPFARRFDLECHRAEQVLYALTNLASSGFIPDVIVAHPGWGETLPVRTVFPKARLIIYCHFFYGTTDPGRVFNGREILVRKTRAGRASFEKSPQKEQKGPLGGGGGPGASSPTPM